ncbi:hypothetical protein sscle_13g092130 [Sclerotinia sclerotiorum 1980 UF-70]|uniref:RING-type E3 ubiquitin transferase n=1 Tax=Sclerotinia sclerotiorum (strain ATCC 18683 / 1980 / Ss-1) TaxID=665079 RepID=A0A1D9QIJ9_SCLS1|nr:hypothetical protein sscle_13g092130 [Sclerotinia sclerotiorum 1980 UF-70]
MSTLGILPTPDDDPMPDVMNDPQYATNTTNGKDDNGDPDTCRICRAEATEREPLFYPCKCSGSIKFVHQDCLMEWLSHSQKKHCELCKTPFRFTKLYSPNMPQSLPTRVFLKHFTFYIIKNMATYLRFFLVIFVWLVALPFFIRQVWRFLFWFSDGGTPARSSAINLKRNETASRALEIARDVANSAWDEGVTPVTPLNTSHTSPAGIGGVMEKLMAIIMPISQTLNISGSDPLTAGFFKSLYYGLGMTSAVPLDASINGTGMFSTASLSGAQGDSLLSNVSFLANMTRSPWLNQAIVDMTEGYIITIVIVVTFILVFLIREWVVQQQPVINMGAAFNADMAAGGAGPREDLPVDVHDLQEQMEERIRIQRERLDQVRDRAIAHARRGRNNNGEPGVQPAVPAEIRNLNGPLPLANFDIEPVSGVETGELRIPPLTFNRQLDPSDPEVQLTDQFSAIWRRAGGDPKEVLEIIDQEGLGDRMQYWVDAMNLRLQGGDSQVANHIDTAKSASSSRVPLVSDPHRTANMSNVAKSGKVVEVDKGSVSSGILEEAPQYPQKKHNNSTSNGESSRSSVWISADDENNNELNVTSGHWRREENSHSNIADENEAKYPMISGGRTPAFPNREPYPLPLSQNRPRAISDVPHCRDKSPLGRNNWAFSDLPDEDFSDHNLHLFQSKGPNESDMISMSRKAVDGLGLHEGAISESDVGPSNAQSPPQTRDDQTYNLDYDGPLEIVGQDGVSRTAENWEEVFENNPISDDDEDNFDETEENPFAPDTPLPPPQREAIIPHRPAEPEGIVGNIANWLWGRPGVALREDDMGANDEHVIEDIAAEAPFVPVAQARRDDFDRRGAENEEINGAHEAAIVEAVDPEGDIEDGEDFDGIMELVGMRGPLFGLVQNAIFSAFLLGITIGIVVWIPYNIGRISILLLANPGPAFKLPLRFIFGAAAFVQDTALVVLGLLSYCFIAIAQIPLRLLALSSLQGGQDALRLAQAAFERVVNGTVDSIIHIADSEIFTFSAASHEALMVIKSNFLGALATIGNGFMFLLSGSYQVTVSHIENLVTSLVEAVVSFVFGIPAFLARPDSWVISLEVPKRLAPLDPALSVWGGLDRTLATLAGFTTLTVLGGLYVRRGTPFSTEQGNVRDVENGVIDMLNQAGGVMKVIFIISIEMLVFPLYCGLLLDAALLPLFEGASIMSRLNFTSRSPLTSIFVHWFVGTCYMFHFALFVSMCRKIMRKGVLHFIRDPDDPTFHPVRDVLERNVTTQLRKILFSALVYGALVVVCLGGVVWGLAFAFKGVLPIHWSSNEPVLEFPVDLLFYNFLMPLAVRFLKPSDALHSMYSWWFRRCARWLRLTWFMFDERQPDEEGQIVRRSWREYFLGPMSQSSENASDDNIQLIHDGRYVRAPASDQVKLPKGTRTFLEVDRNNNRLDDVKDSFDGVHGRNPENYKLVYVPPWFRLRISTFILSIWLFAAATGVCITIVPLVFGRYIFAKVIPADVRKNDVYAFSIGIYILGSALYALLHLRTGLATLRNSLYINGDTPSIIFTRLVKVTVRLARIVWTYTAFILVLPTLFAFLVEFYFIIPMHTYFSPDERHVVHFVQSWTLGLLYVKLTTRIILWHEGSRPAEALRAVTRNGYWNPDARLATRSFIFPATLVLSIALGVPYILAQFATRTFWRDGTELELIHVHRYAYPMVLAMLGTIWAIWKMAEMVRGWKQKIKDEVYLIGERLHNFGDNRKVVGTATGLGGMGVRRIDT